MPCFGRFEIGILHIMPCYFLAGSLISAEAQLRYLEYTSQKQKLNFQADVAEIVSVKLLSVKSGLLM